MILANQMEKWKPYMDIRVTYCFGSKREVLDGSTIVQWLDTDHKGDVTIDRSKVEEYVRELSVKYNTAYCTKKLETSYGQVVSITKGHYGWMIDKKSEIEALIGIIQSGARACLKIHSRHLHAPLRGIFGPNSVNVARYASLIGTKSPTKWDAQLTESNFQTRSSQEREPVYLQTAASHDGPDFGNTYVEMNLTSQHMFFYKKGKLLIESDFVSGDEAKGFRTPAGAYEITYKQMNATLKGKDYKTPIKYWMPFNGNIGMHDGYWRTSFGPVLCYYPEGAAMPPLSATGLPKTGKRRGKRKATSP